MKNRRKARESALQALYQCEVQEDWTTENINFFFSYFKTPSSEESSVEEQSPKVSDLQKQAIKTNLQFARKLVEGVAQNMVTLDEHISEASAHWSLERMSRVDRNILRLGAYEILFLSDDVPVNVSLNEAIEVSKRFGSDESPTFINGILDHIAHASGVHVPSRRTPRIKKIMNS